MTLIFEVVFASIAALLSILSFKTLRTIRHLGLGKTFWIPVLASSITFLIGSAITILYQIGFSLTAQAVEVVQVSRILALSILVGGIYSYSRKVVGSLEDDFSIPEQLFKDRPIVESSESNLELEPTAHEERALEGENRKASKEEATLKCQRQLGYLQTLPKNASIPDECLGCDRVIECKHPLAKTLENKPHIP